MMSKKKINLPSRYTDMAMLGNNGETNRTFIRLMCSAMSAYEKHKNENMKKVIRELSNND